MLGTGLYQSENRCDIKGGGIMCDLKITLILPVY